MISRVEHGTLEPRRAPGSGAAATKSFGELLAAAVERVNEAQWEADQAVKALALGEAQDIHQVTLAMEKADLMLQLAIRVRNKAIEAYQEISRMQI